MSSKPPDTKKDIEAKTPPNTTLFSGVFNRLNLAKSIEILLHSFTLTNFHPNSINYTLNSMFPLVVFNQLKPSNLKYIFWASD